MGEGTGAFWFDLDKILATITEDDLRARACVCACACACGCCCRA